MTDRDDLLRRVTIANPVPADVDLPEDLSESGPPVALLIGDGAQTDSRSMDARWRWWRGPAVAVAAALVVVFAVSVPLLIGGGQEETPPADTTPTTIPLTTTAPPPPATTVPATPLTTDESWHRVGTDTMQSVVGLKSITRIGSRLVAAGFDPGDDLRQDGVIFVSDDGTTWTRLAENDPALTTGTVLINSVIEGGPGLIAVGMSCDDNAFPCESGPYPTVWSSTDGATWTRTVIDPNANYGTLQDVIMTDRGLVAAGWTQELGPDDITRSNLEMWHSEDGANWSLVWTSESVSTGGSPLPGQAVGALVASSDGSMVGVGSALDADGHRDAAVWTSADGDSWERIDLSSSVADSASGFDVVMFDVTWSPSGFVAVGSDFGGASGPQAVIWQSSDASVWTRVDITDQHFETIGSLSSVAALDTGFVVAGPEGFELGEGPVTLWTSTNGLAWDRAVVLDSGYAQSIVVADAGIAVAGALPSADDYHAAVWTGPVFDPDSPPPDPMVPVVGGESSTDRADIGTLSKGFTCEELAMADYSFPEAVTYWTRYDMPADLDPDGNGLPCERHYPESDIADVYGGPEAMAVHIVSDLPEAMAFVATGPAVDAGIICPTGTIVFTDTSPTPISDSAFNRWQDRYKCDDGSGSFILGADIFFEEPGGVNYGIWSIGSGTGAYESLKGGGGSITAPTVGPTNSDTWSDDLVGRLILGTDEN